MVSLFFTVVLISIAYQIGQHRGFTQAEKILRGTQDQD